MFTNLMELSFANVAQLAMPLRNLKRTLDLLVVYVMAKLSFQKVINLVIQNYDNR